MAERRDLGSSRQVQPVTMHLASLAEEGGWVQYEPIEIVTKEHDGCQQMGEEM